MSIPFIEQLVRIINGHKIVFNLVMTNLIFRLKFCVSWKKMPAWNNRFSGDFFTKFVSLLFFFVLGLSKRYSWLPLGSIYSVVTSHKLLYLIVHLVNICLTNTVHVALIVVWSHESSHFFSQFHIPLRQKSIAWSYPVQLSNYFRSFILLPFLYLSLVLVLNFQSNDLQGTSKQLL